MGACGGKDERNSEEGDDDLSNSLLESSTTTPMIVLADVSTLDPIATTPPPTTKRKKRGQKYKKNLSRTQPEFGVVTPRSSSMSFDEFPVEDIDNKTNSDTTVEDLDEENNMEDDKDNIEVNKDNIEEKKDSIDKIEIDEIAITKSTEALEVKTNEEVTA